MNAWATLFATTDMTALVQWCAACADANGGVPAVVGITAGAAGAAAAAGGLPGASGDGAAPQAMPGPNPTAADPAENLPLPPAPPVVPAAAATPDDPSGDAPAPPPLKHPVKNFTSDGGYTISYPNGTVDVHRPDGSAIHVEADGSTWHPIP